MAKCVPGRRLRFGIETQERTHTIQTGFQYQDVDLPTGLSPTIIAKRVSHGRLTAKIFQRGGPGLHVTPELGWPW